MARFHTNGNHPTLGEKLLQHVIVFLICVAFPGGVTMVAPATWLTFVRSPEGVRCSTWTCVFFVVPYKIQHVDHITEIGQRERAGQLKRQREHGRDTNKYVYSDGEGLLQIYGAGNQLAEVSVSPASLQNIVRNSNEFLNSTEPNSTTLFAIANWKFGGLMGGILTLFTMLYVIGYTLGLLKWIVTAVKRTVFQGAAEVT